MNKLNWFEHICSLIFICTGAWGIGMCHAIYATGASMGLIDSPRKAIICMIYFSVIELCGVLGLEVTSN